MANEKKLTNAPDDTAKDGNNASKNKAIKALDTGVQSAVQTDTANPARPQTGVAAAPSVRYDPAVDYQAKINEAAAAGNYSAAAGYEQQRNTKIRGEGLDYGQTNYYKSYLPGGSDYVAKILGEVNANDPNSIYGAYREIITQPGSTTDLSDYLNKLYDANLEAQKAGLEQEYAGYETALDAQARKAEEAAQKNLTRAAVEAQQAQKAWNEAQNAYGLSSGAQGQAALARNNQLQGNVTAIRTAQQAALADIEQQRTTYKQQYEAALREAAAGNDYQRAQALYQEAVRQDEALKAQQSQINEWALSYLSGLGSAASAASAGRSGSSGGSGGSGGGAASLLDAKTIAALRQQALEGDYAGALGMLMYYDEMTPGSVTETVYNAIFGGLDDPYAQGGGGNAPNGYSGLKPSSPPYQLRRTTTVGLN